MPGPLSLQSTNNATVYVEVEDKNDNAPEFDYGTANKTAYSFHCDEGEFFKQIVITNDFPVDIICPNSDILLFYCQLTLGTHTKMELWIWLNLSKVKNVSDHKAKIKNHDKTKTNKWIE